MQNVGLPLSKYMKSVNDRADSAFLVCKYLAYCHGIQFVHNLTSQLMCVDTDRLKHASIHLDFNHLLLLVLFCGIYLGSCTLAHFFAQSFDRS